MDNSKITGITSTFNKYDIKSFDKFLASPWFNTDPIVTRLFHAMVKDVQGDISREKLYRLVTGKTRHNDKHLRYLISALTRQMENFLACRELFVNKALLMQLRLKGLAARDSEKAYDYEHGLYLKTMNEKKEGDAAWYLQRFLNAYQHLNYTYRKTKRKNIIRFDEMMLELDRFYVAKKLQLLSEISNARNVLSAEYKMYLAEEIKKLARDDAFKDIPVIAVYYHVLVTLSAHKPEKGFDQLRSLLNEHGHLFPVNELNDLYQYIRNFCIKKINLGETAYQEVLFEIYKEILSNKKLLKFEYLSQWEYKNITTLGLRLGNLRWVNAFIKKYNYYLRPQEKRNAFIYNMANWHFHNREYSETLKMFQKVEFTDVYYQLDTKLIQLKSYYEMGDEETLFFHAAAFKTFLARNKLISAYQKTLYKNLVNYTLRLVRSGADSKKLKALHELINRNSQVADLPWIRQKVEELI